MKLSLRHKFIMLFSNISNRVSIKSWEVPAAFWEIVMPLIPQPKIDKEKQYNVRSEVKASLLKLATLRDKSNS